jgi:hypothetical protein
LGPTLNARQRPFFDANLQELLRPSDPARDNELKRRQAGRPFELAREVVAVKSRDRRHLLQVQSGAVVLLDIPHGASIVQRFVQPSPGNSTVAVGIRHRLSKKFH